MASLPVLGHKRNHICGTAIIQVGCRLWNVSVISVLFLTICNIIITVRLFNATYRCSVENKPRKHSFFPESRYLPRPTLSTSTSRSEFFQTAASATGSAPGLGSGAGVFRVSLELGRWDESRKYKMLDAALVGEKYINASSSFSVCLATQSSVEKLGSLPQVAHHWIGPMSVALFAAGDEEFALLQGYVKYLRRCFVPISERVAFHVLFPGSRMPSNSSAAPRTEGLDCLRPEKELARLLKWRSAELKSWRMRNPYPQNVLRNLARKNCHTDYVFLLDVDVIPSRDLAQGLDAFLRRSPRCPRCAYVVPTYEIDNRAHFPKNKPDLIRLVRKGLAQPFHHKIFIYNQYATNFSRWENEENQNTDVHISHDVTNFEFLYEPFYVAPDDVPPHNEKFIGYGYTRNTQVYEMFVAGYKFKVLSPVFTCHWGLEKKHKWPPWRERQNYANRAIFEVFKREIFARYQKDPLNMIKRAPTVSRIAVSKFRSKT